ncbi:hypothetical protein EYF80_009069 [Liparis tanakae]|uniref:Uncharacterized protein n=1 Tax=Liparis tanakae TaxID=230148 RepID=A0A4Z2ISH4_9TELE|nr:hypothetical protein EYF80_009069 [Liparis tanakae]
MEEERRGWEEIKQKNSSNAGSPATQHRAAGQTRLKQHEQSVCRGANRANRRSSSTHDLKFPNSSSKNA